ncbi:hypothetical protein HNQ91_000798 [Filimonas zeae]|uniref:DUF4843 domain-containing protein n=1 Tax=Filimonas zeae TaxID=1737353 RepID=A0A917IPU3_9BACT|nr:DUF4843 domain-containing protein [Filimonas zeae]MDR6337776.1 hypothetical protein [Filimonas zeae]GGH60209.1 hypothetical protein GCM10011379_07810 [Filimonas zeae]
MTKSVKPIAFVSLIAITLFTSCQKAKENTYDSAENVYIDYWDSKADSVLSTFAFHPDKGSDTILVPVRIAGLARDYDRTFSLQVLKDSSTAKENVHYVPLLPIYTMLKNTTITRVPVVLLNTDPALTTRSVSLRIKLFSTPDLGANIPERNKTKLVFSNKLEHEKWWDMWFVASTWSVTKNQFFIIVTGLERLSEVGLDAPKNQYLASLVQAFLAAPLKWVEKNPTKGYKMDLRPDGNYDFYNINTPNNKVLYKKNNLNGLFYFIDENGNEVH